MQSALRTLVRLAEGGDTAPAAFRWWELDASDTLLIRSALVEAFAPATARRHLACLRGTLREAWRAGLMSSDAYQRAVDLPPVRGTRVGTGRAPSESELGALFRACARTDSTIDTRDAAMLALLTAAGLRRAEVVGLDVADLSGALLRIRGKGNKERLLELPGWAMGSIDRWLAVRGTDQGPLLLPVRRGGSVQHRRLSDHAVYMALRKLVRRSGINDLAPHDARRGWVSSLLDEGVDLLTVQELAGHANPSTTALYDRRPMTQRRTASRRLRAPDFG